MKKFSTSNRFLISSLKEKVCKYANTWFFMSLLYERVCILATPNFILKYHKWAEFKPSILYFFFECKSLSMCQSLAYHKILKVELQRHWFFVSSLNEKVCIYATPNFIQMYQEKVQYKPSILNFFIVWNSL